MRLWPNRTTPITIPMREALRALIRDLREWLQAAEGATADETHTDVI
jgi:hypothetical protein